jgi:hypothetical protein
MVGPNFRVGKKIGSGNFGELRLGEAKWRGREEGGEERIILPSLNCTCTRTIYATAMKYFSFFQEIEIERERERENKRS